VSITSRIRAEASSNGGAVARVRERRPIRVAWSAVHRFIEADGTSHTRALGYQTFLMVLSGFIGLIGLASSLHVAELRSIVEHLAIRLAPGPSGRLLRSAAQQGAHGGTTALVVGLGAAVGTGTLAMSQIQRSANRFYGLGDDPPPLKKYGVALLLVLSVGVLLAMGGLLMASGEAIGGGFGWSGGARTVFDVVRWILGPLMVLGATWLLFRIAPHERWTSPAAQLAGVLVAVVLWIVFTLGLALDLSTTTSSRTYGSLLSIVGLLVWSGLSALALHLGLATTATIADGGDAPDGAKAAMAGRG
jgi:YihY family inner membrane protein